ncbi:bromodomain associated domain-containing protein [Ditylenchus destructor]|uniref:Transcription initiation factor TFIID subunit 8 n=1 Tax=Ditylenchus destructor TaxID=166010 RepID=A0AAD4MQG6_9BILA|nr:bromodomain associated domain-containing protein [Ditylenchus destructor]
MSAGPSSAPQPSTSSSPIIGASAVHKQVLRYAVGAVCKMAGFHAINDHTLHLMTNMTANFMDEVCRRTKAAADHTGRTEITPGDLFISLVNSGTNITELCDFINTIRLNGCKPDLVIPSPEVATAKPPPTILKVAEPRPHPPQMPSFLPPFPDPHTYIRTEVCI